MASQCLGLAAHLIPWQQHGLDYVLAKEDLPLELSMFAPDKQQAQTQTHQNQSIPQSQQQKSQNLVTTPKRSYATHSNTPQQVQTTHNQAQTNTQGPAITSINTWPPAWQELIKRTAAGPIVWTYWSLGEDLCGNANAERRSFMRKLLQDLGHPKGTNTFWPPALPMEQGAEPLTNTQAFWSGVHMLKGRTIVAMGQAATKAIGLPPSLRPYMHIRHNGCFVVVLRDVDFLISEPQHYNHVREFLRRSLAPCVR